MRIALALLPVLLSCPARAAPVLEEHQPRILVEAPSEVVVGEPFRLSILVSSRWGREGPAVPSAGVEAPVQLVLSSSDADADFPRQVRIEKEGRGHALAEVVLRTPGRQTVWVDGDVGLAGESPPIHVLPEAPAERVYWGDLHAHLHTPGDGHAGKLSPEEYAATLREALEFARAVSLVDFCAVTPHIQTAGGLAAKVGRGSVWDEIGRVVDDANEPGRFVAFPGFEWQGDAGDHCVIYPEAKPIAAPARFEELVSSVQSVGALLTAHAVYLPTRFEPRTPALVAVEVTRDAQSTHALGLDALRRGLVPAFLGCSDTHSGAIGATSLTGLRAPELTRAEIFRAVREGRTWATNGERIVLDFQVDLSGPLPVVRVRGTGTAAVDMIEIFRGTESAVKATGFGNRPDFDFVWEDGDLLHIDHLARPLTYHAFVAQVTPNRYDPSRRDVAISSPVEVRLEARHFDAAHARAGGRPARPPGEAIAAFRDTWHTFCAVSDSALAVEPPPDAEFAGWSKEEIEALRDASRRVERLAAEDGTLLDLAHSVAVVPAVAGAVTRAIAVRAEAERLAGEGRQRGPEMESVRQAALEAHAAAAKALATGADVDWAALERSWFAVRWLRTLPGEALERLTWLQALEPKPVLRRMTADTLREAMVPVDPRTLAAAAPVTAAERRLADEQTARWGYTSPAAPPGDGEPALRVRVVAEGSPSGARLEGGPADDRWEIPLAGRERGWVATLDRARVPVPGDPPFRLRFDDPVRLNAVFVEGPDGVVMPTPGRVSAVRLDLSGQVARAAVHAAGEAVDLGLWAGTEPGRPLWDGQVAPGERSLAFPRAALGGEESVLAQWGFAGWRRDGGAEIPGHDAARAAGFGALADGRALLALPAELVVVDPADGSVKHLPYPAGRTHQPGREFCVAPLRSGLVLVRGSQGPTGGWAALLDPETGEWRTAPEGPETGTVATHPDGGYAWLTGRTIHRRLADGTSAAPLEVGVSGRLMGFDPSGRPVVRGVTGEAVRLNPGTGAVADRIPGPALAMEPTGAVLVFAGLGSRHAELAREVRIERVLSDGTRTGPHRLTVKAAPPLDPPLAAAVTPDGRLLVRAGTTWWRREPEHDWWGASVEQWAPVWAGEIRSD